MLSSSFGYTERNPNAIISQLTSYFGNFVALRRPAVKPVGHVMKRCEWVQTFNLMLSKKPNHEELVWV